MTKTLRRRLSDDALPLDGRLWTPEMWSIFHRHIEAAKHEMRQAYERHLQAQEGTQAASTINAGEK